MIDSKSARHFGIAFIDLVKSGKATSANTEKVFVAGQIMMLYQLDIITEEELSSCLSYLDKDKILNQVDHKKRK